LQLRAEDSIETDRTIETARIEATRRGIEESIHRILRKISVDLRVKARFLAEMRRARRCRFDERISEKRVNHRRLMPRDVEGMSLVENPRTTARKPRSRVHARSHSREDRARRRASRDFLLQLVTSRHRHICRLCSSYNEGCI